MSDRRPRDEDRLRRRRLPSDQFQGEQPETRQGRSRPQAPRRRTSYVPRQGSAQPRQFESDPPEDSRSRDPRLPRRAQQPQYRQETRQPAARDGDYEDRQSDGESTSERVSPRRQRTSALRPSAFRRGEQEPYRSAASRDLEYDDDYSDQYDDSFIDEDDWYEEEAAAGAARPRSSRARRVNTPTLSLPRPTLPRPTVPTSVREAAIVQDQNAIILCAGLLLSVLLLALFTSNRADTLAPGFATHVSASGLQERFRSESALWQLPLMAGALFLMNVVIAWFMAQRSRFLSRFFLVTVALVHVVIWVAFLRIAY